MASSVVRRRLSGRLSVGLPKGRGVPLFAFVVVGVTVLAAIFADALVRHPPEVLNLANQYLRPAFLPGGNLDYPLGTDSLGRDVLSRTIKGTQISMAVVAAVIVFSSLIGTVFGLIAGYVGGWVESLIMRLVDVTLAFPAILIALVFAVTIGPGFSVVVGVMVLLLWGRYTRMVRGEVMRWKARDFVALAKVAGASAPRIIFVHILPNVANSVIVLSTLEVGWVISVEATLSFLGAGIPPPTPTWGSMIAEGRESLRAAWWVTATPAVAIVLIVLAFNMLGDWLRKVLDPELQQL